MSPTLQTMQNYSKYLFKNFGIISQISSRYMSQVKTKYAFDSNESLKVHLENNLNFRKHPGVRHNPCVKLPYKLHVSAISVLNKYRNKKFRRDITQIKNEFLEVFIDNKVDEKFSSRRTINVNKDGDVLDDPKDQMIDNRKNIHLTEPYNSYKCAALMASRLPANYAALSYIFNEIKHEEPSFQPKTLFDFGSGFGTAIWAADEYWKNSLSELFCVDLNENMNELSRELLKNGTTNNDRLLDRIFYRQFLPLKHKPSYDLVVSAFSLLEYPDTRNRIHAIENLWQKTSGMIVFIEHGSNAGFAAIMEARNFILQISKTQLDPLIRKDSKTESVTDRLSIPEASVVAPCPHDLICPRQLILQHKSFCNFKVNYNEIDYGQLNPGVKSEKFAYVVIKKNNSPTIWNEEQKTWPRLIQPVLKKSKHFICRACTSDGLLKEIILSKRKSSPEMYKCAKYSDWGDKLPAEVSEISNNSIDDDDSSVNKEE